MFILIVFTCRAWDPLRMADGKKIKNKKKRIPYPVELISLKSVLVWLRSFQRK